MTPAVTVTPTRIRITMPASSTFGNRVEVLIPAGAVWAVECAVVGMVLESAERWLFDPKAPVFVAGNSL
jgi:hypothetical protein